MEEQIKISQQNLQKLEKEKKDKEDDYKKGYDFFSLAKRHIHGEKYNCKVSAGIGHACRLPPPPHPHPETRSDEKLIAN